jgi:hypothetical protein
VRRLWELDALWGWPAVALVVVISCVNAPLPTTPQPGAPCGVSYVTCTNGATPTGFCCDENTYCCNGTTCPAGMCEQTNDNGLVGKKRQSAQWRAGTR